MRKFEQSINKIDKQCDVCGLNLGNCLCELHMEIETSCEFWLLTHCNELSRTNNTGRLIEYAIKNTRTFRWHRTEVPETLIDLLNCDAFKVYLVFSADRPEEASRRCQYTCGDSHKKTVFLLLDGTWKEVRKMMRQSEYLKHLPILSLEPNQSTVYDLRRNRDAHHLCTVEVAIALLHLIGEERQGHELKHYFQFFLDKYHSGKYNHGGKNDNKTI